MQTIRLVYSVFVPPTPVVGDWRRSYRCGYTHSARRTCEWLCRWMCSEARRALAWSASCSVWPSVRPSGARPTTTVAGVRAESSDGQFGVVLSSVCERTTMSSPIRGGTPGLQSNATNGSEQGASAAASYTGNNTNCSSSSSSSSNRTDSCPAAGAQAYAAPRRTLAVPFADNVPTRVDTTGPVRFPLQSTVNTRAKQYAHLRRSFARA